MKDDCSCLKTHTSSGGGGRGMLPQKILNFRSPEWPFPGFYGFNGEIQKENNSLVPLLVFIGKQISNFYGR